MEFVTPTAMEPGDRIAVVAPSSGGASNAPHVFELGLERLETVFDLEPVVSPTARQSDGFLADSPRARAAEDLPEPAAVAGTLMAMGERGLLERFDGVLLGRVPGRSFVAEPPREQQERYRESVREAVVEQVRRYNPGTPVVCGLDWGHTTPIFPLPVGGTVDIDPGDRRITTDL